VAEERAKRKRRGAAAGRDDATRNGAAAPANRMARGYAKAEQRNQEAREALVPLAEGERPLAVTIGATVTVIAATVNLVLYVAGQVIAAGARRLCVVRAIRDATDPTAAAAELRRIVGVAPGG
jgi:hypothetical protein